jgi:hypothetical protein
MSLTGSHLNNLKRNCCVVYSSDSDEPCGPLPVKPKLDCTPFTLDVSEEDDQYYTVPPITISPTPSPVDNSEDSSALLNFPIGRESTIVDTSSDISDELFSRDEPRTTSQILRASNVVYSDVSYADSDDEIEYDKNQWSSVKRQAHDCASWREDESTSHGSDSSDSEIAVDDAYIDHDSAESELTTEEFHKIVNSPDFDFTAAKKLIHTNHSFDWEKQSLPFESQNSDGLQDSWKIRHHFDYTSVESVPLEPVSPSTSRLETICFSFGKWFEPYTNKYSAVAQSGQLFKTFHLATAGRLLYYMVFREPKEFLPRQRKGKRISIRNTVLNKALAVELSQFMIEIFTSVHELRAYGVNKQTWSGLSTKSVDLDHKSFRQFQKEVFLRWNDFAKGQPHYWSTVLPEIHVYSYGANQSLDYNPNEPNQSLDPIIEDLERQYIAANISTFTFAIASEIFLDQLDHSVVGDDGFSRSYPRALLASTEQVYNQYDTQKPSRSNYRSFPFLFSPKISNFQSETLPRFYKDFVEGIIKSVEDDNQEVVSGVPPLDFVSFQGYSCLQKQTHSDFVLAQTNYAGGHCISKDRLQGANLKKLKKLRDNTAEHRPILNVVEGLNCAGLGGPIAFRFEPVITVSLTSLNKKNRNFEYIVSRIIKPLMDAWKNTYLCVCEKILLPFEISVSPLSPCS